jgi:hypothetical protein
VQIQYRLRYAKEDAWITTTLKHLYDRGRDIVVQHEGDKEILEVLKIIEGVDIPVIVKNTEFLSKYQVYVRIEE